MECEAVARLSGSPDRAQVLHVRVLTSTFPGSLHRRVRGRGARMIRGVGAGALLCAVCLACSSGHGSEGDGRTAGSAGGAGNPAPGPASGPTGSGPADPPPPTDPGNGPTNPPTGGGAPQTAIPHGYHVVAPDVRGLENLAVLTVSRGGKVL